MAYKFLEDLSIADVAFEATGKDIAELLRSAGEATTAVMVKDLHTLEHRVQKKISLNKPDAEQLLFAFLEELVFLKDTEQLLFSKYDIKVTQNDEWHLAANLQGEKIDTEKHEMLVDVKAVTMHHFSLEQTPAGWKATVILDI